MKKIGKQERQAVSRLPTLVSATGRRRGARAHARCWSRPESRIADRDRLFGYLEGTGKMILPEPQPLLTKGGKMPGLMGRRCPNRTTTRSTWRTTDVENKARMPTDPARCAAPTPATRALPVWQLHQVYSGRRGQDWVQQGADRPGIGCIECKAAGD